MRQESLFADETKGGIEVIYSKFIDQRRMDYKALFGGFDHLRVITFSYGLGFVETVADMFEDVEIIIGSMNTVRPDIVDVAMHQKLEMKRLSKRKQLVERVKDGSVRIYFNMRKMSHEKLYILSADDGRCRIITGSANLSKRAFTGGQYEEITCFDGDVVMFDNRLARFESLKGMSSTTPLEPAAMVDFASVAGDSEGELEVVPVMRAKGVVYLCDMPEDDDEVETFYTFNPKDMTEEEREQYAAMREHKVDYKPVTGGRVIIPDEVRRVIRAAREAKAEREVRAVAYPKFHYDTESGAATLNGEAYEVQPEGAWVDDAHRISDIMRGYDSFIGDVEVTKQQFFKVLAFMFTAPFMTRVRKVAMRHGYSFTLFPLYCILYGDSNAGKTTFMELCLQAMYGSPQTGKVSHEEWTPTGIKAINSLCPEMGLLIDDMPWKRFQTNADAIIKRDGAWLNREDVLSPIYTLTVNKMGGLKPELAKRSVPIRTEVRIDRERVAVGIRRPESKELNGRLSNLRGMDSCILFECRTPKGSFDWVVPENVISERVFFKVADDWYVEDICSFEEAKAKRRERWMLRNEEREASLCSFHPTKAFLDKWVRGEYGWKTVKPSDVLVKRERICGRGFYFITKVSRKGANPVLTVGIPRVR